MDEPNYILKTDEAVYRIPEGQEKAYKINTIIGIVLTTVLLALLLFGDFIDETIRLPHRLLFCALAIGTGYFGAKKKHVPSPIEFWFYDKYMVIYRPKRYYNDKLTCCEYNTIKYSDITKCTYKTSSKWLHFFGTVTAKWYEYNPDGTLKETPRVDQEIKSTFIYISTRCSDVDFAAEIEAHSPIKVTREKK